MIQYICRYSMNNNDAKIHLSEQESELVLNKDWILLKHSVLEKVMSLLGELHENYKSILKGLPIFLPDNVNLNGGKISRGEKYKGLPYMILDYPAIFSKEDIFAVRTLFWWGNYFSITLHLSGKYFQRNKLSRIHLTSLESNGFLIYSGADEWDHEIGEDTHIELQSLNEKQIEEIEKKSFFKIVTLTSLTPWEIVPEELVKKFRVLCDFLITNYHPNGETNL